MKSVCSYYCTLPGPGGHHSNYTHFSRKIDYCHWFDKLIIEGNVYTYDEGTNRIVRIGAAKDRRRPIQERDIPINHGYVLMKTGSTTIHL